MNQDSFKDPNNHNEWNTWAEHLQYNEIFVQHEYFYL